MTRLAFFLFVLPLAVIALALAVANRASVPISLDPFNPGNPALSLSVPLFLVVFVSVALGIFIGGVSDWIRQGYWRREARAKRREARGWRNEADRLRETMDQPDSQPRASLPRP